MAAGQGQRLYRSRNDRLLAGVCGGLALVLVGALLLLSNYGFFDWLSWGRLWPLLLILLGVALLVRR